jgi:LysR family glycine cleavage system transcriptional activator
MIGSLILARPEIDAGLLVHPFGPVIEGESYHMLATPANMACADVRAVCAWLVESVAGFAADDHPLPAA